MHCTSTLIVFIVGLIAFAAAAPAARLEDVPQEDDAAPQQEYIKHISAEEMNRDTEQFMAQLRLAVKKLGDKEGFKEGDKEFNEVLQQKVAMFETAASRVAKARGVKLREAVRWHQDGSVDLTKEGVQMFEYMQKVFEKRFSALGGPADVPQQAYIKHLSAEEVNRDTEKLIGQLKVVAEKVDPSIKENPSTSDEISKETLNRLTKWADKKAHRFAEKKGVKLEEAIHRNQDGSADLTEEGVQLVKYIQKLIHLEIKLLQQKHSL